MHLYTVLNFCLQLVWLRLTVGIRLILAVKHIVYVFVAYGTLVRLLVSQHFSVLRAKRFLFARQWRIVMHADHPRVSFHWHFDPILLLLLRVNCLVNALQSRCLSICRISILRLINLHLSDVILFCLFDAFFSQPCHSTIDALHNN